MESEASRILLIEDDPDHAELVERGFAESRPDCKFYHVSDGEEALDFLFRRGRYVDFDPELELDVVLLDLRLPRVDGFEVLRALKADTRLRYIPTVVLSTSAAEADVRSAYDYGANSYLVKPTSFAEYADMLRDVGAYWLKWNRLRDVDECRTATQEERR